MTVPFEPKAYRAGQSMLRTIEQHNTVSLGVSLVSYFVIKVGQCSPEKL